MKLPPLGAWQKAASVLMGLSGGRVSIWISGLARQIQGRSMRMTQSARERAQTDNGGVFPTKGWKTKIMHMYKFEYAITFAFKVK